jgi:hypothetical protein
VGDKSLATTHKNLGSQLQDWSTSNKDVGLFAILYYFKYLWWSFTLHPIRHGIVDFKMLCKVFADCSLPGAVWFQCGALLCWSFNGIKCPFVAKIKNKK